MTGARKHGVMRSVHSADRSRRKPGPGRTRALVSAVLVALVTSGCYSFVAEDPPQRFEDEEVWGAETPVAVDPDDPYGTLSACYLIEASHLNQLLESKLEDGLNPWDEAAYNTAYGRNECQWREPLSGDKSVVSLTIWSPTEASVIGSLWSRDTAWQVNEAGFHEALVRYPPDPGPEVGQRWWEEHGAASVGMAFFDPGTSEYPNRTTHEDGSQSIAAFANFNFEVDGVWMTLQASGEVAILPDLKPRLSVAAFLVSRTLAGYIR